VLARYERDVKPAFDKYIAPGMSLADVVLPFARINEGVYACMHVCMCIYMCLYGYIGVCVCVCVHVLCMYVYVLCSGYWTHCDLYSGESRTTWV